MRFNDFHKPNLACKIGIAHLRGCAAARNLNIVDYNPDKKVDKKAVQAYRLQWRHDKKIKLELMKKFKENPIPLGFL